jgi:hypothetical protein
MRRSGVALIALAVAGACLTTVGSSAAPAAITPSHRSLSWMGGPITGAAPDEFTCVASSCDDFTFRIDIPSSAWRYNDGGVVVRIQWPDPNDEIDLHVYDDKDVDVASSIELHTTSEQTLIHAPRSGVYRVHVVATHAANVRYRGTAWVGRLGYKTAPVDTRSPMRFGAASFVDPQTWTSEPGTWIANDASVYTTAIWSLNQMSSMVWRSDDGAQTFRLTPSVVAPGAPDPRMRPCDFSPGGADADVVTDRTGRLYFVDLWITSSTIGVSEDRGKTWSCNPVAPSTVQIDRPWLAPAPSADGSGPNVDAYLSYHDDGAPVAYAPYLGAAVKAVANHLDVTRDGGRTWQAASIFAADRVGVAGPIFTSRDGIVYQPYTYLSSVWIARSTDEGRTMRLVKISDRFGSPANLWLGGDVDAAGNVYVAWVEQGSWDVLFTRSTDRGLHWSDPVRLNPPASETATMPWVAAGRNGDVAVAWYGTRSDAAPDNAPASARWSVWVARSLTGNARTPKFQSAVLSQSPVRFGPLCTSGVGCFDRKMGDFFEIDLARDGALIATFSDTGRIQHTDDGYTPGPYVMAVRQTSGLGMPRAATAASEPAGDAEAPQEMAADELETLDLTSLPGYRKLAGAFRLDLKLRSATDLSRAVGPGGSPIATDAYWLVLWKANERVEYAGMHLDRDGNASFFGGDEPVSVGRPDPLQPGLADKLASYPETFRLNGRVDIASRSIFIDVPLAIFHLRKGDVLNSVQAFSMTSLLDRRTFVQPLVVVDSTPARAIRIS